MEFLQVLSKHTGRKKRRRKTRFLLPETEAEFTKAKNKARKLRSERIAAIFAYGAECLTQATNLRNEARRLLSVRHQNDAEYELARRDAKQRKDEAGKLCKKGRKFRARARWLTLCFWKFPDELDTSKDYPTSADWSCRSLARYQASNAENAKIAEEGDVVHKKLEPAKKKEYWHHERRLVRYQGRLFLVMMAKRVEEQPHAPWRVSWVTESTSQMTEEELRCAASQSD